MQFLLPYAAKNGNGNSTHKHYKLIINCGRVSTLNNYIKKLNSPPTRLYILYVYILSFRSVGSYHFLSLLRLSRLHLFDKKIFKIVIYSCDAKLNFHHHLNTFCCFLT